MLFNASIPHHLELDVLHFVTNRQFLPFAGYFSLFQL